MIYILVSVICIAIITLIFYSKIYSGKSRRPTTNFGILITGCDSGIGYSLASHCAQLGLSVFAACLDLRSSGAQHLLQLREQSFNVHVIRMDVRDSTSVTSALTEVKQVLAKHSQIVLKALVNNAGVMVFGEFAWLTEEIIQQQIDVNLVGAMRVTKTFLPMIVNNKGRLINICSHCSLQALPGLSAYAASKAGLLAWSDALRIEMKKFGIPVVTLLPGSFPTVTNILANQKKYAEKMRQEMAPEDWNFCKDYFLEYNAYINGFEIPPLQKIQDKQLYSIFEKALLLVKPKAYYSNSPFRYTFYHVLFKIVPTSIRDKLVIRFVNMPKWKNRKTDLVWT